MTEREKSFRSFIREARRFVILTQSTESADRACQKNGIGLADLLRPFSKLEKINFSFRGIASEFILPDFAVDFVDASQMATPSEALADSNLTTLISSVDPRGNENGVTDIRIANVEDAEFAIKREWKRTPANPWLPALRDGLLRTVRFQQHDMFDHPIASIIAISSTEADPVACCKELGSAAHLPAPFQTGQYDSSSEALRRIFVIVHDVCDAHEVNPNTVLQQVRAALGSAHSVMLLPINTLPSASPNLEQRDIWSAHLESRMFHRINSPSANPSSSAAMAQSVGSEYDTTALHESPNANPGWPGVLGCMLTDEDLMSIRNFTHKLVQEHALPFLQQRVTRLNAHVSASKKGIRNALKSWWGRKPKDAAATAGAKGTAAPKMAQPGHVSAEYRSLYLADSVESQTRLLGDYCFLLDDYEAAHSMYKLVREDYKGDKNYRHYAAAIEASALCLYMYHGYVRDVDVGLAQAVASYVSAARAASSASSMLTAGATSATASPVARRRTAGGGSTDAADGDDMGLATAVAFSPAHTPTGKGRSTSAGTGGIAISAPGAGGHGGNGLAHVVAVGVGIPAVANEGYEARRLALRMATLCTVFRSELSIIAGIQSRSTQSERAAEMLKQAAQAAGPGSISSAVLTEQAAYALLYGHAIQVRRFGHLLCQAAELYVRCANSQASGHAIVRNGIRRHAVRALSMALTQYVESGWRQPQSTVQLMLAKQLMELGDAGATVGLLAEVMATAGNALRSSQEQVVVFREFVSAYTAWFRERTGRIPTISLVNRTSLTASRSNERCPPKLQLQNIKFPAVIDDSLQIISWENAHEAEAAVAEILHYGAAVQRDVLGTTHSLSRRASYGRGSLMDSADPLSLQNNTGSGSDVSSSGSTDVSSPALRRNRSLSIVDQQVGAGEGLWSEVWEGEGPADAQGKGPWVQLDRELQTDLQFLETLAEATDSESASQTTGGGQSFASSSLRRRQKARNWKSLSKKIAIDLEDAAAAKVRLIDRGTMISRVVDRHALEPVAVVVEVHNPLSIPVACLNVRLFGEFEPVEGATAQPFVPDQHDAMRALWVPAGKEWQYRGVGDTEGIRRTGSVRPTPKTTPDAANTQAVDEASGLGGSADSTSADVQGSAGASAGAWLAVVPVDVVFGPQETKTLRLLARPLAAGRLKVHGIKWHIAGMTRAMGVDDSPSNTSGSDTGDQNTAPSPKASSLQVVGRYGLPLLNDDTPIVFASHKFELKGAPNNRTRELRAVRARVQDRRLEAKVQQPSGWLGVKVKGLTYDLQEMKARAEAMGFGDLRRDGYDNTATKELYVGGLAPCELLLTNFGSTPVHTVWLKADSSAVGISVEDAVEVVDVANPDKVSARPTGTGFLHGAAQPQGLRGTLFKVRLPAAEGGDGVLNDALLPGQTVRLRCFLRPAVAGRHLLRLLVGYNTEALSGGASMFASKRGVRWCAHITAKPALHIGAALRPAITTANALDLHLSLAHPTLQARRPASGAVIRIDHITVISSVFTLRSHSRAELSKAVVLRPAETGYLVVSLVTTTAAAEAAHGQRQLLNTDEESKQADDGETSADSTAQGADGEDTRDTTGPHAVAEESVEASGDMLGSSLALVDQSVHVHRSWQSLTSLGLAQPGKAAATSTGVGGQHHSPELSLIQSDFGTERVNHLVALERHMEYAERLAAERSESLPPTVQSIAKARAEAEAAAARRGQDGPAPSPLAYGQTSFMPPAGQMHIIVHWSEVGGASETESVVGGQFHFFDVPVCPGAVVTSKVGMVGSSYDGSRHNATLLACGAARGGAVSTPSVPGLDAPLHRIAPGASPAMVVHMDSFGSAALASNSTCQVSLGLQGVADAEHDFRTDGPMRVSIPLTLANLRSETPVSMEVSLPKPKNVPRGMSWVGRRSVLLSDCPLGEQRVHTFTALIMRPGRYNLNQFTIFSPASLDRMQAARHPNVHAGETAEHLTDEAPMETTKITFPRPLVITVNQAGLA